MGFSGRIIAILFLLLIRSFFIVIDLIQNESVSFFEYVFTFLLIVPMYYLGLRYDRSRFYLKELHSIRTAIEHSAIVSIFDTKGIITYVNDKFCSISKYKKSELLGKKHPVFNTQKRTSDLPKKLWSTISSGNIWRNEEKYQSKDGNFYWVDTTIVPSLNEVGKPYQYVSISYDITERISSQEHIKNMAYHDSLTGLYNRNYLDKYLEDKAEKNNPKENIALFFIDLDRFKNVNDSLGHKYGDLLIKEVAKIIKKCVREEDFVFRYGGDEFVVVLEKTNCKNSEEVCKRIVSEFSKGIFLDKRETFVTSSIGVSLYPEDCFDVSELLKNADAAMYYAKEKGKNNYKFYHSFLRENDDKKAIIEKE